MNSDRARRALEILDAALALDENQRRGFIHEACGDNVDLRNEVLANLGFHDDGTLVTPSNSNLPEPELQESVRFEDRYDLKEEVARGGVGRVVRAIDKELGREVAIKFLLDPYRENPDMIRRFITEAQISGHLSHPGITAIHEIGKLPDGGPFISMKLVEGNTLASMLKDRSSVDSDLNRFIGIFNQVCQTIAYAHSKGVVHRDIKPDNVMVSRFSEVQVMDWGLAKFTGDGADSPVGGDSAIPLPDASSQTRIGAVMGTPAYMPPEQAIGLVSPQLDVFALGGMLCEILTGDPTYTGESPATRLEQATQGRLVDTMDRLRKCNCDPELKRIAQTCLDPDPQKRPADAGELAKQVQDYLNSFFERARQAEIDREKVITLAQEKRRRTRIKVTAVGVAFALIMMAVAVIYSEHNRNSKNLLAVETRERGAAESVSYWATTLAAFREINAGDNYQAFQIFKKSPTALRNWEWQYLRDQIDSSQSSFEVPDRRIRYAALTDNNRKLLLMDGIGPTLVVDPETGELLESVDSPQGRIMAVSDDGELVLSIAFRDPGAGTPKRLLLWSTRSGEVERDLGDFPLHEQKALTHQCQISPDKKFFSSSSTNGWMKINLHETATGRVLKTFEIGGRSGGCAFSPDGKQFVCSNFEKIHFWDLENQCEARPSIDAFARVLKFSPTGNLLAGMGSAGAKIWDLSSDRVVAIDVRASDDADLWAEFSRDGKLLIVPSFNGAIQKWNTETGELVSTFGLSEQLSGKLGPYSWRDEQLVIPSATGDDSVIRVWNTQDNQTPVLTGHTSFVYPVRITSDGKTIVSGAWDKTVRIWDGDTRQQKFVCTGHGSYVHDLVLDERNQRIVSVDYTSRVCIWNMATGELLASRKFPHLDEFFLHKHVAYTPDKLTLLLISQSSLNLLNASDLSTRKSVQLEVFFEARKIRDMKTSPSGKYVGVIVVDDYFSSVFHLLELENLSIVRSLRFDSEMQEFEFSPDEQSIAFGSVDGMIELRSMTSFEQLLWAGKEHNREVFALKFLPDSTRLFTGGRDGGIRIWDTKDGTVYGPLMGHTDYVYSMDISADGTRLVSGSGDSTVRIWEAKAAAEDIVIASPR